LLLLHLHFVGNVIGLTGDGSGTGLIIETLSSSSCLLFLARFLSNSFGASSFYIYGGLLMEIFTLLLYFIGHSG
jgi:Na+/melibiose symporter-like transporter